MINKAEFLEKIRKKFVKENEECGIASPIPGIPKDTKYKFEIVLIIFILFSVFSQLSELAIFLGIFAGLIFFWNAAQKESPVFRFLINSGLCETSLVQITKEEFKKKYNTPDEILQRVFKNSDTITAFIDLFSNGVDSSELFKCLFNLNGGAERLSVKMENVLIPFKEDNATFHQVQLGDFLNGRKNVYFNGWVIQVKLNRSYKKPVVFIKRKLFGGRKGLKKIELRRQDPYFDVLSNDVSAAENLCYQGIPAKLLRLNNRFKFDKIEAVFIEDKLFIAIHTETDLFKGMKRSPEDIHQYEIFYDQVAQLESYCAQFRNL